MPDNQEDLIQQSKNDSLARGEAFYELVRTRGWEFVKKYYEARLKALVTALIVNENPITEYDNERRELVGIRKLFGYIESDLHTLDEQQKSKGTTQE